MSNIVITLLYAIVMGAGQVVLSFAAKDVYPEAGFSVKATIFSRWLWLGIFMYAAALMLWVYVLSRFDVKYAYPIASTAIFFAAIFHSIIQKSFPPVNYWIGLAVVIVGLSILSLNDSI